MLNLSKKSLIYLFINGINLDLWYTGVNNITTYPKENPDGPLQVLRLRSADDGAGISGRSIDGEKWGQTFKFQLTIISKWIEYGYGEAIEGGI